MLVFGLAGWVAGFALDVRVGKVASIRFLFLGLSGFTISVMRYFNARKPDHTFARPQEPVDPDIDDG